MVTTSNEIGIVDILYVLFSGLDQCVAILLEKSKRATAARPSSFLPFQKDHDVIRPSHYMWFSWFWSHFFLHYMYSGSCTITSKAKINVCWKAKYNIFWNFFFTPGPLRSKKFQKTLILAFEANSAALSRENETKIVKITHSASLRRAQSSFFSQHLPRLFWLRSPLAVKKACLLQCSSHH